MQKEFCNAIENRPATAEEVKVILFEPASVLNTGNMENEKKGKVAAKTVIFTTFAQMFAI